MKLKNGVHIYVRKPRRLSDATEGQHPWTQYEEFDKELEVLREKGVVTELVTYVYNGDVLIKSGRTTLAAVEDWFKEAEARYGHAFKGTSWVSGSKLPPETNAQVLGKSEETQVSTLKKEVEELKTLLLKGGK